MTVRKPTKTGNTQITRTGHTYSGQHGSTPSAQVKGRAKEPTPQKFG